MEVEAKSMVEGSEWKGFDLAVSEYLFTPNSGKKITMLTKRLGQFLLFFRRTGRPLV